MTRFAKGAPPQEDVEARNAFAKLPIDPSDLDFYVAEALLITANIERDWDQFRYEIARALAVERALAESKNARQ